MANDFKVILSAVIRPEELKKELDNFFNSYKAPISAGGVSGSSSGSGSGSGNSSQLSSIQKLMQEDEKRFQNLGKLQSQAYAEDAKRTAQTQADIQKLGNMQLQAAEANKKFDADEITSQEKLNAEFTKYQQQVDVFLAKTQNRDLSKPGASEALGVRTDMQGLLNGQATPEAVAQLDALGNKAKVADANFQGLNATTQTFNDKLVQTIKSSIQTALSIGLIYNALGQLKEGIQYVIDLNKEMTNIQLVTGQSSESLNEMARGYNRVAGEMGSTTLEIAKTSTEFIRQGRNATETAELIKQSTILQKLGNMEATDATEKLTATMNGFQMEVSETAEAVDKLVNNIARTYRNIWKISIDKYKYICYSNF